MWNLMLALATAAVPGDGFVGRYQAVTETEYSIGLTLAESGRAKLVFRTWSADDSEPPSETLFRGSWSRTGEELRLHFKSGDSARFEFSSCLSYVEFGRAGCSAGFRLVETTLPSKYGLQRFGLWRSDTLRLQP